MRKLLILAGCLLLLCRSVWAVTLEPEDYIVNPDVLGSGIDDTDNKIELYDNAAWPGDPYSLIAGGAEDIQFTNIVHIRFTNLIANQWYALTANMPYSSDWDYSYISASDAVGTNRLIIPASDGVMHPGQTDGNGNLSIYLADLNGGAGYRGIDSFTLTTTTAPGAPPTQSRKTYRLDFLNSIVNTEVLGSGIDPDDDKMELYYGWSEDSLIAHNAEDILLANVVHVKLTGVGLDPNRSYDLLVNMQYPSDWDYSYQSAADAVGPDKLTLSKDDGQMEDIVRDGDGSFSIYFGDLSNGGAGYCGLDYFTVRAGPLLVRPGTIVLFR